ncbi:hypothetical protein Daus18300_000618 [Diaporthe australafricana]|uniref:Transmembrane protein n=1 Tax=Diaporthe australafricana TaxID=127596 RepID=A0ABR3Y2Q4_9PEZI
MENFNATQIIPAFVRATSEGSGAANTSTSRPRISLPRNPPVKNPMVAVYIIIIAVLVLGALLIWRDVHNKLMTARTERLDRRRDPNHTYKTKSVWLKLPLLVWTGLRALCMSFIAILTPSFWKDLGSDARQTCSPLSSCGISLNAYSCGLICNQDTDEEDAALPVTGSGNGVVAKSFMAMSKMPEPQQPVPTLDAGAIV